MSMESMRTNTCQIKYDILDNQIKNIGGIIMVRSDQEKKQKQKLLQEYEIDEQLYKNFLFQINNLLSQLIDVEKISSTTTRLKDRESLAGKIEKKQEFVNDEEGYKYNNLKDITDICGIRICTFYSDDVDEISKIIESEFVIDKKNSIDKRKSLEPDRFGYLSLHYIVSLPENRLALPENTLFKGMKIEIQIRSILQHTWAEIEHDIGYKSSDGIPKAIKRDFSRLAGLLELADKEFISIRDNLKEYKNNINESIQHGNMEKDIFIDRVSLKELISSEHFHEQVNFIYTKAEETIINVDSDITDEKIDNIVKVLKYLKVNTINEFLLILNKSKYMIINMYLKEYQEEKAILYYAGILYYGLYYENFCKNLGYDGLENIFEILRVGQIDDDFEALSNSYKEVCK